MTKKLRAEDCMSGTGWMPDDTDYYECPECSHELDFTPQQRIVVCPGCEAKLKIQKGIMPMIKLEVYE